MHQRSTKIEGIAGNRMNILHLDSSLHRQDSISRLLSKRIVAQLKTCHPDATVFYRDLDQNPLPHVTLADLADPAYVDEFLWADVIVLGAPMYNLSVPSTLKTWLDRVVIAGKTFRYGPGGAEGLAGGRRIVIASSRGNVYAPPSPLAVADHQESYLKTLFQFLGVTDIVFVRVEGVGVSAVSRRQGLENALVEISKLT
jgi:FMN-dependent NADH-azoreductase